MRVMFIAGDDAKVFFGAGKLFDFELADRVGDAVFGRNLRHSFCEL